ncbi:MAG: hypothetical protein SaVV2_gp3 [Sanya virga-like virus 2]|nr:MAG: hypothetical protein SaVV2_gp3 [Sanya virga-like virus 2]
MAVIEEVSKTAVVPTWRKESKVAGKDFLSDIFSAYARLPMYPVACAFLILLAIIIIPEFTKDADNERPLEKLKLYLDEQINASVAIHPPAQPSSPQPSGAKSEPLSRGKRNAEIVPLATVNKLELALFSFISKILGFIIQFKTRVFGLALIVIPVLCRPSSANWIIFAFLSVTLVVFKNFGIAEFIFIANFFYLYTQVLNLSNKLAIGFAIIAIVYSVYL